MSIREISLHRARSPQAGSELGNIDTVTQNEENVKVDGCGDGDLDNAIDCV
jgi:hypothetical protein